ncbi:LysR family transcriptional regulator [Gottfriedia sp. NPDC057991]|uniref:LysR family transcriptional regulator n=1 Tax=Gottfriedia sp. NPDC057991 TaxID=3346298 RepID=UPI0036DC6F15
MKIEQLEYLLDVLSSGSFLIAAKKNLISESDIRQSITSLENEFGFKLFKNNRISNVVNSIEGLQIISIVKKLLMEFQELELIVKDLKNNSICEFNYRK